ncbi:transglycosylase SLT domain-containing protein [Candidatus Gracilibacteria bacterium]|nr:transglycosylase SLT domain-containing protein [Candidatus Gracilibacteria bacterium]
MSEQISNHLEGVMKKVIQEGSINSDVAKTILNTYEAHKNGMLVYTKETLAGLRKVLGIQSHEGLFGMSEVLALKKIVGIQVSNIISNSYKATNISPGVQQHPQVNFHGGGSIPLGEVMLARGNYEKHKANIWPVITKIAPIVDMNPEKILAVCAQESRFDIGAKSQVGARGLMQIMPQTLSGVSKLLINGKTVNAGPEEKYYAQVRETAKSQGIDMKNLISSSGPLGKNIIVGTIYLSYLLKNFGEEKGLQVYNGGTGKTPESRNFASGVKAWEKTIVASNSSENKVA